MKKRFRNALIVLILFLLVAGNALAVEFKFDHDNSSYHYFTLTVFDHDNSSYHYFTLTVSTDSVLTVY